VLWESHAICRYLAMQYGGEAIYPSGARIARASIDRWMDWLLATVVPVDVPVFLGHDPHAAREAGQGRDRRELVKKLSAVFQILEERLAGPRPISKAIKVTLADLLLGIFVYRYLKNPLHRAPGRSRTSMPGVKGYACGRVIRCMWTNR
jgi:glutathione S-transferase